MKIAGIIAEYNPFHNGHKYHIEKAKELTNADKVIVVMSGNFVQRGMPAIIPKHIRAETALHSGADLVVELPVRYACASAEFFAFGAVSHLHSLGCVDSICFGSECGDISMLQKIADILSEEPDFYRNSLQTCLRLGYSFPLARQKALYEYTKDESLVQILEHPNNILGIEYLKAVSTLKSRIKPYTLAREGGGYHDTILHETYSSASAIRKSLAEASGLHPVQKALPDESLPLLRKCYQTRYPVYTDDFSLLFKYRLLNETADSLIQYDDVSCELANRIIKNRNRFIGLEQFCTLLKTKELTYARISRALFHILLGLQKDDCSFPENNSASYIRILGFRRESTDILTQIKKHSALPMIPKLTADLPLSDKGRQMLDTDIYAANLYESVITDKFKTPFVNEYEQQVIRI